MAASKVTEDTDLNDLLEGEDDEEYKVLEEKVGLLWKGVKNQLFKEHVP